MSPHHRYIVFSSCGEVLSPPLCFQVLCGVVPLVRGIHVTVTSSAMLIPHPIATGIGLLWSSSRPSASLVESQIIDWQTSFYSCTVSHNIMCTLLIAGRLWYFHRKTRKLRASEATPYASIIAIIVESAALYSLCGIVYIPLVVRMLPAQFAVTALIGSLTVSTSRPPSSTL